MRRAGARGWYSRPEMSRAANILIVDDDANLRQNIHFILEKGGMKSAMASSGEEALQRMRTTAFDLVLLDVQMPGMGGLEALRIMRERHPDVGVIMCSVLKDIAVAVEAMHTGALDYVTKDFSPPELIARVRKTLAELRAGRELERLHDVEATQVGRPMVLGSSSRMRAVVQVAEKIAPKPVTVLITGESGTGKEVLARYIHARSDRKTGPFVAVNLPAIPANLVESELFGHERGAFTGADRQKLGKFELANGGTLFLDEIGDLALDLQGKILRALQALERYSWPGNIRELENIMARMAVVCDSEVIEEPDLPFDFALSASAEPEAESGQSLDAALLAFEKSFLRKALKRNQWNRKRTAELLQIGYSTLKAKLKSYGIVAGVNGDED